MALTVTGVDANGRVAPKGTNVIIPPQGAGIGDLVYKQTSVFTNAAYNSPSYFKVVGRGTADNSVLTIGGTSYTLYGCIYGFVSGMAMICAPGETSAYWATSGYPSVADLPIYGGGTPLMRNGNKHTYVQMNTAQNANYIKGGSSAPVTLGSAYQATSLTGDSDFNALAADSDIKLKYGTWTEYIRQALRVNGAPGTPFGASYPAGKVKVHEFGRWMTKTVHGRSSTLFPAINYCYGFCEGNGTWWLPSMFELAEMMIDEHYDKVNENGITGWTDLNRGSNRWSCVLRSSTLAWIYNGDGMSYNVGFSNDQWTVRPVTLLKLVS